MVVVTALVASVLPAGLGREPVLGAASTRGRVTSVSATGDIRALAAAQSQASAGAPGHIATQLTLDLGDTPRLSATSGLPEMTGPEQVRAELEVLGLDASGHVVDFYGPLLDALGVTRARDLLSGRSGREVLVAGVKVATQTPPIRTGRRVVFLTLDDATGPADLTFFEDVQGPYAATVFHSWLLLCRGVVRRTGPRGVSIRATGAWELSALQDAWTSGGITAVRDALDAADRAAWERATALAGPDGAPAGVGEGPDGRRVLVHASGFKQSPYADIKPAGDDVRGPAARVGSCPPRPSVARHASCGTRAREARGTRVRTHTNHTQHPRVPRSQTEDPVPDEQRPQRRGGVRPSAVVSAVGRIADECSTRLGRPLEVLDLGGGTVASPSPARRGRAPRHRRRPSPDALASLARRTREPHRRSHHRGPG